MRFARTLRKRLVSHREDGRQPRRNPRRGLQGCAHRWTKDAVPVLPARESSHRLTIAEGPIDALSLAVLEDGRPDTVYVATGGGMGAGPLGALQALLARLAAIPDALIVSAADANAAGDRYAECHAGLAADAGVRFERRRPPEGLDFNDVLKQWSGI